MDIRVLQPSSHQDLENDCLPLTKVRPCPGDVSVRTVRSPFMALSGVTPLQVEEVVVVPALQIHLTRQKKRQDDHKESSSYISYRDFQSLAEPSVFRVFELGAWTARDWWHALRASNKMTHHFISFLV